MISFLNLRGVINLMAQDGQKVESTRSNSSQWSWFWDLSKALSDVLVLFVSCEDSEDMKCFPFKKCIPLYFPNHRAPKPTTIPTHHSPWRNWMKRSQTEGEWGHYRQVPEKWWKVHKSSIELHTFYAKQHYQRYPALEPCSMRRSLVKDTCWWTWTENWKWLKYAKMRCGFISNHIISCQLCFLLPSSCALHARSKSPAVPRAAPWVDEGHLHANLMTTSVVFFWGVVTISQWYTLGPGVSNMLISLSKSEIPIIVVNPAAVQDHKISPLIRVYQPSQLVAGEKRCAASHGRRCWQLWCTVMGSEAQKRDDN